MPTFPNHWTPNIAAVRSGVFTAAEAHAAGMTDRQILYRLETGLWIHPAGRALILREALADPMTFQGTWQRCWSAALTWPDGVVSGAAGAVLTSGLPPVADGPVDMLLTRSVRPVAGLRRRRIAIESPQVTECDHGPRQVLVARQTQSLLDALRWLPWSHAWSVVSWIISRHQDQLAPMRQHLADQPGRAGNQQAAKLLEEIAHGRASAGEAKLHHSLRAAGITGWQGNAPIHDHSGRIVAVGDVVFYKERLVVEVDGSAYHGVRELQRDSERNNRLVQLGWRVLHFTWDDVMYREADVIAQICAMLAAPPESGRGTHKKT